jgi:hypothetical protein
MKGHSLHRSSILAVLVLLIALSSSSTTAQRPTTRQQQQRPAEQQQQQEEVRLPELTVQELNPEALRVSVPHECAGIRPDVQIHDVNDNFNPPGNPVTLSASLASYLSGKPIKGYDDPRLNMVFADNFKLRNCRVCYATLEFRVQHPAGSWSANAPDYSNDTIIAGVAPFPTTQRFFGPANIWSGTLPNPKTMTLSTTSASLALLNQYLMTGPISRDLHIVSQDDSTFDSVKLTVWYY